MLIRGRGQHGTPSEASRHEAGGRKAHLNSWWPCGRGGTRGDTGEQPSCPRRACGRSAGLLVRPPLRGAAMWPHASWGRSQITGPLVTFSRKYRPRSARTKLGAVKTPQSGGNGERRRLLSLPAWASPSFPLPRPRAARLPGLTREAPAADTERKTLGGSSRRKEAPLLPRMSKFFLPLAGGRLVSPGPPSPADGPPEAVPFQAGLLGGSK